MAEKKYTVKELLSKLAAADDNVARARATLKQAESEYDVVEDLIFKLMDEQETDQIKSVEVGLQVSIQPSVIPQVLDWSALEKFVLRNKRLDLFQRRLSAPAVRDLIEARKGVAIPGVTEYEKRRLHVTKSKTTKVK